MYSMALRAAQRSDEEKHRERAIAYAEMSPEEREKAIEADLKADLIMPLVFTAVVVGTYTLPILGPQV